MESFLDPLHPKENIVQIIRVAEFIDTKAGDFPLVSGMPSGIAQGLLWQYSNHDFIVYFDSLQREVPTSNELKKGSPSCLRMRGLDEAFEFIRSVEQVRQKTVYPRVLLGIMPGTVSSKAS